MTDILPNVVGDNNQVQEATPVIVLDSLGNPITPVGGVVDDANSTFTALGANETFTGAWVTNSSAQIAVNVIADQDGEMFLELSPDGGTTITLSKRYDIRANEPRFDALVKMPGRSHRLRYVNGPVAQTAFKMLVATGQGLFPFATSDRDKPVFVAYSSGTLSVSGDVYAILVDLSDTTTWPHNESGSVDLWSSFLFVDKSASGAGQVQLGVITRIDGTDADISYIQGVSFNNASDNQINRDRILVAPIRLAQSGGNLTSAATLFKATNVAAVNTATPLASPLGSVTPAVGDLVVRFALTAGSFSAAVSAQYAGNVNT